MRFLYFLEIFRHVRKNFYCLHQIYRWQYILYQFFNFIFAPTFYEFFFLIKIRNPIPIFVTILSITINQYISIFLKINLYLISFRKGRFYFWTCIIYLPSSIRCIFLSNTGFWHVQSICNKKEKITL